MSINIGILGSTGYTGCQLVSLLLNHNSVDIRWLTSEKFRGMKYSEVFPGFAGRIDTECVSVSKLDEQEDVDLVFSCLPNLTSIHFVKKLYDRGIKIIDLSSDLRLKDLELFKNYFNREHPAPGLAGESVYGMPELNRAQIKTARLVANPGCFATTVLLSLAPLLKNGIKAGSIVADVKAPISGAGRAPRLEYHFPETNQNITGDGFEMHIQKIEVEEFFHGNNKIKENIVFRTHRVPVNRGILTTVYYELKEKRSYEELLNYFEEFYRDEKFVRIREKQEVIQLKNILNSNYCDICFDIQDGFLVIESVLDNAVKGASGQAVQNMNIMFDIKEDTGLGAVPVYP